MAAIRNLELLEFMNVLSSGDRESRFKAAIGMQTFFYNANDFKYVDSDPNEVLNFFSSKLTSSHRLSSEIRKEIAKCIGALGYIMVGKHREFISWIFDAYEIAKDDVKSYYLRALATTCTADIKSKRMDRQSNKILSEAMRFLESTNVSSLIPIIEVIIIVAETYPDVFKPRFEDAADIIIGWYIDMLLSGSPHVPKLEFQISKLSLFWSVNLEFTSRLLKQFLEDAEQYSEDLHANSNVPDEKDSNSNLGDEDGSGDGGVAEPRIRRSSSNVRQPALPPVKCLDQVSGLLRVFYNVLNATGELPNELSAPIALMAMNPVARCLSAAIDCGFDEVSLVISWVFKTWEQCLKTCKGNLDSLLSAYFASVCKVLSRKAMPALCYISACKSVISVCGIVPTDLLVPFVNELIGVDGCLRTLRFHRTKKIALHVHNTYRTLLKPTGVKCLQEVYRYVLGEIELCVNTMCRRKGVNSRSTPRIFRIANYENNPFLPGNDVIITCSYSDALQYEAIYVYLLSVLQDLASVKNSVIAMWALVPNLFSVLASSLPLSKHWFSQHYPSAYYVTLTTLKLHCARHDWFISTSDAISNEDFTASNTPMVSQTASYFSTMLSVMRRMLLDDCTKDESKVKVLEWVQDVIEAVVKQNYQIVFRKSTEFLALIEAICIDACTSVGRVNNSANDCIDYLLKIPKDQLGDSFHFNLVTCKALSCGLSRRKANLESLTFVPYNLLLVSCSSPSLFSSDHYIDRISRYRRGLQKKGSVGQLQSAHFKCLMQFLLQGNAPAENREMRNLWFETIQKFLFSSMRNFSKDSAKVLKHAGQLWWWAVWELAGSCVASRLKTPLGKPQETFMAIESCIKSLANQTVNFQSVDTSKSSSIFHSENASMQWFQVRHLLYFMEALEKHIYAATSGTAFALYHPNRNAKTFFTTNSSVCSEWLARIRLACMSVALHNQDYAMVLRLAKNSFDSFGKNSPQLPAGQLDLMLQIIVESLERLQSAGALRGIHAHVSKFWNLKNVDWMLASVENAQGNCEEAIDLYKKFYTKIMSDHKEIIIPERDDAPPAPDPSQVVQPTPLNISTVVLNWVTNDVLQSYLDVADLDAAVSWANEMKNNQKLIPASSRGFSLSKDFEYVKYLQSFGDENESKSLKEFTVNEMPSCDWSMTSLLDLIDRKHVQLVAKLKIINADSDQPLLDARPLKSPFEDVEFILNNAQYLVGASNWPSSLSTDIQMRACSNTILFSALTEARKLPVTLNDVVKGYGLTDHPKTIPVALPAFNRLIFAFECSGSTSLSPTLTHTQLKNNQAVREIYFLASKQARKQHQFQCSARLLRKYLLPRDNDAISLQQAVSAHTDPTRVGGMWVDNLNLIRHYSKYLMYTDERQQGFRTMANALAVIFEHASALKPRFVETEFDPLQLLDSWLHFVTTNDALKVSNSNLRHVIATCLTSLSDWLQADEDRDRQDNFYGYIDAITDESIFIQLIDNLLPSSAYVCDSSVVGALRSLSATICPSVAKTQLALAEWAFKAGQKILEVGKDDIALLNDFENKKLIEWWPVDYPPELKDDLKSLLGKLKFDSSPMSRSAMMQSIKEVCGRHSLVNDPELNFEPLMTIWDMVNDRVSTYFDQAISAYFRFLRLQTQGSYASSDIKTVKATLRLLRLLVTRSCSVATPALFEGVIDSSPAIWTSVIPQLFARLNHPSVAVRTVLSKLLCRIAMEFPEAVAYQAVVGSQSGLVKSTSDDDYQSASPVDDEEDDVSEAEVTFNATSNDAKPPKDDNLMRECCSKIKYAIEESKPELIQQMQLFVDELARITLLWDELWLLVLTHLKTEIDSRLRMAEREFEKTQTSAWLTAEKRQNIFESKQKLLRKSVLWVLKELQSQTCQSAHSGHEKLFQDSYGGIIDLAIKRFQDEALSIESGWQSLQEFLNILATRSHKKQSMNLNLKELSPNLAALSGTEIPLPGVGFEGSPITVESVAHQLHILPTKTKPKRIWLLGSDGRRYPYLFKGLEDLHLDERVMQLLTVINKMFVKPLHKRTVDDVTKPQFCARNYAVTPLGQRSGLIQWVDGATPLFSIYKRWQIRQAEQQQAADESKPVEAVKRPAELFHQVLDPLLKQKHLSSDDKYRHLWPASTLRTVLQTLCTQTPADLLQKELWCQSTSASEWWNVTQMFNRSTALMSVVGYLLGLGDRHLDNLLVDLNTGELIHIDYNVCFEKGKQLKVPEGVPCRLTQNIVNALGLTGVEGEFRSSCEQVLTTLKGSDECLLTLLEAFVYDPLVDWTLLQDQGSHSLLAQNIIGALYGSERIDEYRALNFDLIQQSYQFKVEEHHGGWIQNRDQIKDCFGSIEKNLEKAELDNAALSDLRDKEEHSLIEQKLLSEATEEPTHPLWTLGERHAQVSTVQNEFLLAKRSLRVMSDQCEGRVSSYKRAFDSLNDLSKLYQKLRSVCTIPVAPHKAALDLLTSAGQQSLVQQCSEATTIIDQTLTENLFITLQSVFRSFLDYRQLQQMVPISHYANHRVYRSNQTMTSLLNELTLENAENILNEFFAVKQGQLLAITSDPLKRHHEVIQHSLNMFYQRIKFYVETLNTTSIATTGQDDALLVIEPIDTTIDAVTLLSIAPCDWMLKSVCLVVTREINIKSGKAVGDATISIGQSTDVEEMCQAFLNFCQQIHLLASPISNPHLPTMVALLKPYEKLAEGCEQVCQAMSKLSKLIISIVTPCLLRLALEEQPAFNFLYSSITGLIAQLGVSLIDFLAEFDRLRHGQSSYSETLTGLCMKIKQFLRQMVTQMGEKKDTGMVQMSNVLKQLDIAFDELSESLCTLGRSIGSAPLQAWLNVDIAISCTNLLPGDRYLSNSAEIFPALTCLMQLVTLSQLTEQIVEYAKLFRSENIVLVDEVSLQSILLVTPTKLVAETWRHCVFGIPSAAICLVVLSIFDELKVFELDPDSILPGTRIVAAHQLQAFTQKKLAKENVEESQAISWQQQYEMLIKTALLTSGKKAHVERVDTYKCLLPCIENVSNMHQWCFEEYLPVNIHSSKGKLMKALDDGQKRLRVELSDADQLENALDPLYQTVEQRLKWQAGANPMAQEALDAFEMARRDRRSSMQSLNSFVHEMTDISTSLLHLEKMCQNLSTEAGSFDDSVQKMFELIIEKMIAKKAVNVEISNDELILTQNEELPNKIDAQWVQAKLASLAVTQNKFDESRRQLVERLEHENNLHNANVESLKAFLQSHHRIMSDLRAGLRAISKNEESSMATNAPFSKFIPIYKRFSEDVAQCLRQLTSINLLKSDVKLLKDVKYAVGAVKNDVQRVFDALPLLNDDNTDVDSPSDAIRPHELVSEEKMTGSLLMQSSTNITEQMLKPVLNEYQKLEPNPRGLSVWMRVKQKLEGIDSLHSEAKSVERQVDQLIIDATSNDNLALMYEGWTPWV